VAVLGIFMFLPMAQAAEEFECTICFSGTYTYLHKSKEVSSLMNWQRTGIVTSESRNKFLANATYHGEGVQVGRGEKKEGYEVGKFVDPNGDLIIIAAPYTGRSYDAKFLQGTGKYKGIKGSYTSKTVSKGRPAMPGTYQRCSRLKGTFEMR
jgi:hypothetical protein